MGSTFAIVRTSPTVLPSPHLNNREFKIPRQRRPRKRRSKSKFAFLQCLSQLFQLIYFVKCKRTLFEPNCKETYTASERDRLFSRRLVMSFIKREIRHFSVAVEQWRQRNVQKSVMRVQSCCFAGYSTYCFFDALVVVAVVMKTKTFQDRVKCAMANCGVWEEISMGAPSFPVVYGWWWWSVQGTRNTTLLGDEGVERPETFDQHCTKVKY